MTACICIDPVSLYRLVKVSVNPAGRFGASLTSNILASWLIAYSLTQ